MANEVMTITTGEVRFSYVRVFKPSETGKYELTCILPKSDTATKALIDQAIAVATNVGIASRWGGVKPPNVPNPVWDGDGVNSNGDPYGPECKGCWVFSPRALQQDKPLVCDSSCQEIIDQSEIYSGAYGKVRFTVYPYFNKESKKKGIGFYLRGIQKLRDGEGLGGARRESAVQMFGAPLQTDANGFVQAPKIDPFSGQPLPY